MAAFPKRDAAFYLYPSKTCETRIRVEPGNFNAIVRAIVCWNSWLWLSRSKVVSNFSIRVFIYGHSRKAKK